MPYTPFELQKPTEEDHQVAAKLDKQIMAAMKEAKYDARSAFTFPLPKEFHEKTVPHRIWKALTEMYDSSFWMIRQEWVNEPRRCYAIIINPMNEEQIQKRQARMEKAKPVTQPDPREPWGGNEAGVPPFER